MRVIDKSKVDWWIAGKVLLSRLIIPAVFVLKYRFIERDEIVVLLRTDLGGVAFILGLVFLLKYIIYILQKDKLIICFGLLRKTFFVLFYRYELLTIR